MPIDFSYLEGAAPQEQSTPVMSDTATVTIRVDADSLLLCDGEYIDQVFKAGVLTKIQMYPGQHLLEFLYAEDPDIKVEKEVDFPESGKNYLVIIKGLKDLVDAAGEAKRKAEEAERIAIEEEARAKAEAEAKRKAEEAELLKEKSGTINGYDYVDLGLPSGLKWATCNVGAVSPEKYGDYYAWGEVNTKSGYTSNNSKTEDKRICDISGNSTYDVARKKWGSSWRMPTEDEILELRYKCKWLWTTKGGKNGYKVLGPNGNTLFLPATGICIDSELYHAGTEGQYWSSTPEENYDGFDDSHAYCLHFYKYDYKIECDFRYYGQSVRPVSK